MRFAKLIILLILPSLGYCQPDTSNVNNNASNLFVKNIKQINSVLRKYQNVNDDITTYSIKALRKMKKQEDKLRSKLIAVDSVNTKVGVNEIDLPPKNRAYIN